MRKDAKYRFVSLHAFVELTDTFFMGKELSKGVLHDKLRDRLSGYLKDGRTRSTKRALSILSDYSVIQESRNRFDEITFRLKGITDESNSIFLSVLAFLYDSFKDRTIGQDILDRIETLLPLVSEPGDPKGYFPHVPSEEDILVRFFSYSAQQKSITPYDVTKQFHSWPAITRLYILMSWLSEFSREFENDTTGIRVMTLFYSICQRAVQEQLDFRNDNKLLQLPSDMYYTLKERTDQVELIKGAEPFLSEIVKKKLGLSVS